jgi:uncharacterized protein YfaP (DUF2135 family)
MKSIACLMLGLGLATGTPLVAQTTIDLPSGGWRSTTDLRSGFVQEVNYPASSVNSDGISAPALIRGQIGPSIERRIANTRKSSTASSVRPATLVANGVAMPLALDERGAFSRPYAFGSGSNSLEVRVAGAERNSPSRQAVQFYDAGSGSGNSRVVPGLRVVLSWSSGNTDLDLHVITPSGGHAYYGNRVLPDGSALDVDVTTGYGPEIWAAPAPAKGVYHVYVNYFGAGEIQDALTIAEVAIVSQEGSLHEKRQIFRVPLRKPGELMLVRSFVY